MHHLCLLLYDISLISAFWVHVIFMIIMHLNWLCPFIVFLRRETRNSRVTWTCKSEGLKFCCVVLKRTTEDQFRCGQVALLRHCTTLKHSGHCMYHLLWYSVSLPFFHSVHLSRILWNTPIISLNNIILLVLVLDICMFSVRQELKFCALVRRIWYWYIC